MKIVVFDIDGTITEEVEFLRKFAPKFIKKTYGVDVNETNPYGYTVSEIYNLYALFKNNDIKSAESLSEDASQKFWNHYFVKYCRVPVKEGVKETIDYF